MATSDDALNAAQVTLGSGPEPFWAWYPAPAGPAWCAIACSKWLTEVGIPTHFAWVSGLFDRYRSEGRTFAPHEAQPGDLVAFDYDVGGPSAYDHIAMVESVDWDRGGIVAINGNWQNRVQRVFHSFNSGGYAGGIAEIARPAYTTPTPPTPEDDDMKSIIMVDPRNGANYHVVGNTKVWLTKVEQVQALMFLGVPTINPAPTAWLDACATLPRNDPK